ncbi:MAG TPA: undecaprenyl-phosphate galactose phosphotransferase WbaP [Bacillota bacterium]|nr:undecaprenyl-phosphate galactose phosphotransferase WbaP [Bacillota bacterium]
MPIQKTNHAEMIVYEVIDVPMQMKQNINIKPALNDIDSAAIMGLWPRDIFVLRPGLWDRVGKKLVPLFLLITDYLSVFLAIRGAFWMRLWVLPRPFTLELPTGLQDVHFYLLVPLFYLGLIFYEGLYRRRLPFWANVGKLIKICTFATAFTISILYFTGSTQFLSRVFVFFMWFFSCASLIAARYLSKRLLSAGGLWRKPVVIVGTGNPLELLAKSFQDESNLGYQVAGVIAESDSETAYNKRHPYRVIGNLDNLEQAIQDSRVSEVIIALPELERNKLLELVNRIQPLVKNVTIFPDLHGLPLNNLEAETFFNQRMVLLRVRNNLRGFKNLLFKRVFDLVLGAFCLIFSLPLMVLIALLIKLDSPGKAVYSGKRLGKGGREFKCYKFRTMFVNEREILDEYFRHNQIAREEWKKYAKLRQFDPRVTRVGRWLRKLSLDELPQIINVLKGDMSLVGPRPYLPMEQDRMKHHAKTIFETWPGITGLWQVRGRNELEFEERVSLESWYVRNWSLWLDISLMIKTIQVVLARKGAY